jgi:membrane fusion protein (multidrug efflux system)
MGVKVSFLDDAQKPEAAAAAPRATVRVPSSSVVKEGENAYVWRVRDNRLERVAVRVGAERDGQTDVLSGINGGELVVTKQIEGLAEGAPVKEKEAE